MGDKIILDRDKRQFDRKQLYYYIKVFHQSSGKLAGYLGDISPKGLMLFTPDPFATSRTYDFYLELDPSFELGSDRMECRARALWCEKDVNPDYHVAGFEFMDLPTDQLDIIEYLIQKYGF